jgi:effector-binding domain-containing protein
MLDAPQVTRAADQRAAVIHLTVPREEIRSVMGPVLGELMAAVAAQGIAPAGPWFTHHLGMDPAVFDFEIGVPVAAPVVASGREKPGQWPASKVARAVYHGPYEGLAAAWGEFDAWIAAEGHNGPGPLGTLRRGAGVEPRPGLLAHGARPSPGRLSLRGDSGPRKRFDTATAMPYQ